MLLAAALLSGCKPKPVDPIADEAVKVSAFLKCPYGSFAQVYGKIQTENPEKIKSFGFCWGGGVKPTVEGPHTEGKGTLERFDATISPLSFSTDYYVRAYAQTDEKTYYSALCGVTTDADDSIKVNGVGMKMVFVEGGTFWMGAQNSDPDAPGYINAQISKNESPVHEVTVSDYWIGEVVVTQRVWKAVMGRNINHSDPLFLGPSIPEYEYLQDEGQQFRMGWDFLDSLNAKTGLNFRLPTEAEWEYAACGGKYTHGYRYSGSNNIYDVAWYMDNSFCSDNCYELKEVGLKQPNELGLYDMSGNLFELCSDQYMDYGPYPQVNPMVFFSEELYGTQILRGGSIMNPATSCRVTFRSDAVLAGGLVGSLNYIGIRLAISDSELMSMYKH